MPGSEQGIDSQHYQVIPRTLVFITRDDEILLLKGSPNKKLWANKYNGIGGHIEAGEDVYSSVRRELFEESGLDIQPLTLCGSVMINVGEKTGIHIFIFKGEYKAGDIRESKEGSLEWIKKDALLQLPLVEDLKVILPALLSMEKGKFLFARYHYDEVDQMKIDYFIV